ncbi:glycosyltransferase family 2 protein [Pseudoclavibacter sp. JSM 162008]|uniref:glycosyltransferase family 2 protein n=1 Tax=Pseudoclavibacter sp. JSM 162008 TaxID=3229855 RepID=UPI00352499C5
MKIVMTMMVRDEADIIAAVVEHSLAQGIDHLIVTDNASVDGTREILEQYEEQGVMTLLHDPEHKKQQAQVVTRMARSAYSEHGADWVINGDADEFVFARERSLTVRQALERYSPDLTTFRVPVVNMVGSFGREGSGLARLRFRDERSIEQLNRAGVFAHPTPNAIHVGSDEVEVAHGNHFVSLEQQGDVPEGFELEVLHVPWRSWSQFERKTVAMALGFEANPGLRPSANHHGMRDWRRYKAGVLEDFFALRMPTTSELADGGYVEDTSIIDALRAIGDAAVVPAQLSATLDDGHDEVYSDEQLLRLRERAALFQRYDDVAHEEVRLLREEVDERNSTLYQRELDLVGLRTAYNELGQREAEAQTKLYELQLREDRTAAAEHSAADARAQAARLAAELLGARQQLQAVEQMPAVKLERKARRAAKSVLRR